MQVMRKLQITVYMCSMSRSKVIVNARAQSQGYLQEEPFQQTKRNQLEDRAGEAIYN